MNASQRNSKSYLAIIIAIIGVMAIILYFMGRVPICDCGYIKLWHGIVVSSENSQHIFDWYTFTHVSHGLIFYGLLSLIGKRLSFWQKLIIAIAAESAWEMLENTDAVINRYRAATISLDYFGDSIINSIGDVLAMIAGFLIAYKKPLWLSVAVFFALEIMLAVIIKDNLSLNIIMLLYPIEAIKFWQSS